MANCKTTREYAYPCYGNAIWLVRFGRAEPPHSRPHLRSLKFSRRISRFSVSSLGRTISHDDGSRTVICPITTPSSEIVASAAGDAPEAASGPASSRIT